MSHESTDLDGGTESELFDVSLCVYACGVVGKWEVTIRLVVIS